MMPTLVPYDRIENSRDHVLNYKIFMELQLNSDALLCKVFSTTLTGPAQIWFNSLELESVGTFFYLANLFICRFIASILAGRKTSYLETIKKRQNESLREYMAIFNSEALQIPDQDETRAIETM